jgi:predicted transcriptional regulator
LLKEEIGNRSREEIIAEILTTLLEPQIKTMIMYKSKLSYSQLKFYHRLLLDKGLIREDSGKWVITEKGISYLRAYDVIHQLLNSTSAQQLAEPRIS